MKERIREVPKQVSRQKLQRAEEVEYWLDMCRITNPARLKNWKLRCKLLDLLRTSLFRVVTQITQKNEVSATSGLKPEIMHISLDLQFRNFNFLNDFIFCFKTFCLETPTILFRTPCIPIHYGREV